MDIHQQIPLKNYLTMKLGGPARFMLDIHTTDELLSAHRTATAQHTPIFILGGGSNVIARDEGFAGIVLRMRIPGFEVLADDLHTTTIKVGAGEIWDSVVQRTVEMRLGGIEAMSAIPGTAGAAPVQNIGAYGQEVSDTLVSLEAYDSVSDRVVTLINNDCGFAYRQSIFRTTEIGRYVILNITLRLSKNLPAPPFYSSLQAYLDTHHVTSYTHQAIREAVTAIRADKLPDPAVKPNSGSFFKNPIIEEWLYTELTTTYPDMPSYDMGGSTYKIPAGWLIEQSRFKGALLHGIRVNPAQCLVLINESATCYQDLADARDEITDRIRDTYRITLEQEPLEIV